jgi:hypothetical protein
MSQTQNGPASVASLEEMQKEWRELASRIGQLETERNALELENKSLRSLLERAIEHRQKSHAELVTLLTSLVTKLPINDVGVVVSKLVEHNTHVTEVSASLVKGKIEDNQLQPAILKALEKTKRDLLDAVKSSVAKLNNLDAPFEAGLLESLVQQPDTFFSPTVVRAARCYIKGQVPRERVVKEFGEEALVFFKDLTTDVKYNPRPKPDEIVMTFNDDFETALQQNPNVAPDKRQALLDLYRKIQKSRAATDETRTQRNTFLRLSFVLELLHYYENQSTESPDVIFAQRLPPLIEQVGVPGENGALDERLIKEAESLLAFIIRPDHRFAVINNTGKSGGMVRTLRFVLAFRAGEFTSIDPVTVEFVKHLIPADNVPKPESLAPVLRLLSPAMQMVVVRAIIGTDRLRRDDASVLGKAVAKELGLKEVEQQVIEKPAFPPEQERQLVWDNIKELIASRASPNEIASAIRNRLRQKYDADEIKHSWLVLTGSDAHSFIRVFCLLPYLPDGTPDPIGRPVLESYVQRLIHEKYAETRAKVVNALRNMFRVKPDSPALINFLNLVKWVDPAAAAQLSKEIGIAPAG